MSEEKVAKAIGAKLVKNSGRGTNKGDFILGRVVFDLKEVSRSFQLTRSVWDKISNDAATYGWGYIPALLVTFKDGPSLVVMNFFDWRDGWDESRIPS